MSENDTSECLWPPPSAANDENTNNEHLSSLSGSSPLDPVDTESLMEVDDESGHNSDHCEAYEAVPSSRDGVTRGECTALRPLSSQFMPNAVPLPLSMPFGTGAKSQDKSYVRMPDKYPPPPQYMGQSRWNVIQSKLSSFVKNQRHNQPFLQYIEDIIYSYNGSCRGKWDFRGLSLYYEGLKEPEKNHLCSLIDKIGKLAVRLPELCPTPVPLLKQRFDGNFTLKKLQIACLLANAFFCTFPSRNTSPGKQKRSHQPDALPLPSINFSSLFQLRDGPVMTQNSKFKCIFNYFERVTQPAGPDGNVTFERFVLQKSVDWKTSTVHFTDLVVTSSGTIEEEGKNYLKVDFANKLVGGGVLGRGSVQEEIMFLGRTEAIVSRLFTEELMDNECLIITGCERYNRYSGYGDHFQWDGDYRDTTERDDRGRCISQVVVIDAHKFFNPDDQYQMHWVDRELNKAYCGFVDHHSQGRSGGLPSIATGNWGCGAFHGNRELKSLIQLMAAAQAGRAVYYFTMGDAGLVENMFKVHSMFREKRMNVGDAYLLIEQYGKYFARSPGDKRQNLYEFILDKYS